MLSKNQQQLLSDEVADIINYKPGWVIRRGNFIFLLVLSVLALLTFIIRYPDVVKASVRIAALNAPKMLTANTEGRLEKLFVTNGQQVKKGQQLAYLQSIAKHEQVIELQKWIVATEPFIDAGNIEILLSNPLPVLHELGELQAAYQDFQNNMLETKEVLWNGYYQKKKRALEADLQFAHLLKQKLENQAGLQQEDLLLQKIEYNANEKLADEKVIAPLEFNREKSKLLGKKQSLELMSTQLINNDVTQHDKNKELLDLQKFVYDQKQKYRSELLKLKSRTAEWQQKFIVTAPEDGKLEFTSFIQENQLLSNGQELFFVQPNSSLYYAEMKAGQNNLGKIKTGQKVFIRLEGYPSEEFGYVNGKITYISNMPNARDSFLVRVELPGGLRTNYNKDIFFRNGLSASAEIMTDEKRLADKLFGRLKNVLNR
jgi:multidrug efflux pump subunit AcrA (membrane-fusion protein)